MADLQTVRVVATDPASQGPFVVINARDFDPAVHKPYDEAAPAESSQDTPGDVAAPKRRGRPPKEA